jgi:GT2 family glycosyltransferase
VKTLVAIPTLARADLLVRNREFLESIRPPDMAYVIDNGKQKINLGVPIERPVSNLGVSGSWNRFLRIAFLSNDFDLLVLLQDDIIWDAGRLAAAKRLAAKYPDVDLFLSYMQFAVQVHRPSAVESIGYYDERFHPAYCEDDDWAIRMTQAGRVYERFHELDPLPGSQIEGTHKPVPWKEQNAKLFEKWGAKAFGVNIPDAPWYRTNREIIRNRS